MRADSIDFKFGNDGSYVLTIEGKEIGVVHELEHAEMIAEISNRDKISTLESEVARLMQRLENEQDNYNNAVVAYKMSLKKIHDLSSIIKMDPSVEQIKK
jgi:hypothetical protein